MLGLALPGLRVHNIEPKKDSIRYYNNHLTKIKLLFMYDVYLFDTFPLIFYYLNKSLIMALILHSIVYDKKDGDNEQ